MITRREDPMHNDAATGHELHKTSSGRWAIGEAELTSGSSCEVHIQGHWIRVRIESYGGEYYAIPRSVRLHEGLLARLIG